MMSKSTSLLQKIGDDRDENGGFIDHIQEQTHEPNRLNLTDNLKSQASKTQVNPHSYS